MESFAINAGLADKLGRRSGASRAAVRFGLCAERLARWARPARSSPPELYIARGASPARIQHLAGNEGFARVIVAINKDEEAPIFQVADYGLVAEPLEAIRS